MNLDARIPVEEIVAGIAPYVELGFDELLFHLPAPDQERALDLFARDVLPRLRERWPTAVPARA